MQTLTHEGQDLIRDISRRYGLSRDSALTFSSQYGTINTLSLPLVSGPGLAPAPSTNFAHTASPASPTSHQGSAEIVTLLEKLGQLRDAGVLSHDEFNAKKADLLNRL